MVSGFGYARIFGPGFLLLKVQGFQLIRFNTSKRPAATPDAAPDEAVCVSGSRATPLCLRQPCTT